MPGTQPAKPLAKSGFIELLALLCRLRHRIRVSGDSMLPLIQDGDELLYASQSTYRSGDLVVARHPFKNALLVKRVFAIDEDGHYDLRGDNAEESTDSRSLGNFAPQHVLGCVTSRFRQAGAVN